GQRSERRIAWLLRPTDGRGGLVAARLRARGRGVARDRPVYAAPRTRRARAAIQRTTRELRHDGGARRYGVRHGQRRDTVPWLSCGYRSACRNARWNARLVRARARGAVGRRSRATRCRRRRAAIGG